SSSTSPFLPNRRDATACSAASSAAAATAASHCRRRSSMGRSRVGPRRAGRGGGSLAAALRQRLPRLLADLQEQLRVVDRQLGELLAVQADARLLHAVDERRVAQAERSHRGGEARDPERAEAALLLLAAGEGERVGADDRLVGHAEQVAAAL